MTRRQFVERAGCVAGALSVSGLPAFTPHRVVHAADEPVPGPADWLRYGADLRNTRSNPNEKIIGKGNVDRLKEKWHFQVDVPIATTPTIIGDTLFFGSYAAVYALDARTGREKWRFDLPKVANGGIQRGLEYYKGRLYGGDDGGWVRCLDAASGKEIWSRDFSKDPEPEGQRPIRFSTACIAFDDKIYTATTGNKNRVLCLNAANGTTAWEFWVTGQNDFGKGGSVWTSPAFDVEQRLLYVPTGSNKFPGASDPVLFTECILAFDAESGYLRWFYQSHPNDIHDLDWSAHPVLFDAEGPPMKKGARRQCVAAGAKDGFYCIDRYTGELIWRTQLTQKYFWGGPNVDEIAFADNKLFVVSNAATQLIGKPPISVTAALDAFTGRIVWWTYNLNGVIQGAIAVANQVLYQGFNDGRIEALDSDSGAVLWQHALPTARYGGFAIANGAMYVSNGVPGATIEGGGPSWNPPEMVEKHRNAKAYSMYCFTVDGK
jgi:glucose dehydrogenase